MTVPTPEAADSAQLVAAALDQTGADDNWFATLETAMNHAVARRAEFESVPGEVALTVRDGELWVVNREAPSGWQWVRPCEARQAAAVVFDLVDALEGSAHKVLQDASNCLAEMIAERAERADVTVQLPEILCWREVAIEVDDPRTQISLEAARSVVDDADPGMELGERLLAWEAGVHLGLVHALRQARPLEISDDDEAPVDVGAGNVAHEQVRPAAPDRGYRIDEEITDGAEFIIYDGETGARLRYIETRREHEEGCNCPRVAAHVERKTPDGWQNLFEIYVHDPYGSIDESGHSYPMLETAWVHARPLYDLVSRFGSPTPRAGRAIIDAIGQKSPVRNGMARFHQVNPESMGTAIEEMYYAVSEARLDELWEMKEEASRLWDEMPESAIPLLEALDQALAAEPVEPENAHAIFKARYLIEASVAFARGEVKTPIIASGDTLVGWHDPS